MSVRAYSDVTSRSGIRGVNPTGRVDVLLTRLAAAGVDHIERECGIRPGTFDSFKQEVARWSSREFGPRRRRPQ